MNAITTPVVAVPAFIGRPGALTTAQLGNEGDTSWCPSAPCLVLMPIQNFVMMQWYAVVKREGGDLILLLDTMQAPRHCYSDESDAVLYCTSAINITNGDMDKRLSKDLADQIHRALACHHAAVEALETHTRIFRN